MLISDDLIEIKKVAGTTQEDTPVVYIKSYGGLHAFFTKKDNQIKMIGAAPHWCIAKHFAEKEEPKIKWNAEFNKNEFDESNLNKSLEETTFDKYRKIIFSPIIKNLPSIEFKKYYFVYNTDDMIISIADKSQIIDSINKNIAKSNYIIRDVNLNEELTTLGNHIDFELEFKRGNSNG